MRPETACVAAAALAALLVAPAEASGQAAHARTASASVQIRLTIPQRVTASLGRELVSFSATQRRDETALCVFGDLPGGYRLIVSPGERVAVTLVDRATGTAQAMTEANLYTAPRRKADCVRSTLRVEIPDARFARNDSAYMSMMVVPQ